MLAMSAEEPPSVTSWHDQMPVRACFWYPPYSLQTWLGWQMGAAKCPELHEGIHYALVLCGNKSRDVVACLSYAYHLPHARYPIQSCPRWPWSDMQAKLFTLVRQKGKKTHAPDVGAIFTPSTLTKALRLCQKFGGLHLDTQKSVGHAAVWRCKLASNRSDVLNASKTATADLTRCS